MDNVAQPLEGVGDSIEDAPLVHPVPESLGLGLDALPDLLAPLLEVLPRSRELGHDLRPRAEDLPELFESGLAAGDVGVEVIDQKGDARDDRHEGHPPEEGLADVGDELRQCLERGH